MDAINAEIREDHKKFLELQSKKKNNSEFHRDNEDDNDDSEAK